MSTTSSRLARWLAAAALVVMLATGLCTFQHYGFTIDEPIERRSTLVNYQYVLKTLFNRDLRIVDEDLSTYGDRYYGVALQMPTVVIEDLIGFSLQNYHVFLMRHLYTFLLCMAGYVCFYFFLRNVFENDWLALLGALMLALYPRFWGEQFTNIKDMVFMATYCADMLCVSLCLKHEGKWRYEALAAFVFALSANSRVLGILPSLLLLGYRVLRDLCVERVPAERGAGAFGKNLARYLAQPLLTLVFFVLITPAAWEQPLAFVRDVFLTFSNFGSWHGNCPFLGKLIHSGEAPGSYIPIWLGISLPLWYLALLLTGLPVACVRARHRASEVGWARALLIEERYYLLALVIAALPIVYAMLFKTTLYGSWRHVYYTMPSLVVMMLFTLRSLWAALRGRVGARRALAAALCLLLAWQGVWIIKEHPMEKVYFNPIGKRIAHLVDRDYWRESVYHLYQYLLARDDRERIVVVTYGDTSAASYPNTVHYNYLTWREQKRIRPGNRLSYDGADYIINYYKEPQPQAFEGFTLIREMAVDGVPISALFIRNDVLEERFGGVYPE